MLLKIILNSLNKMVIIFIKIRLRLLGVSQKIIGVKFRIKKIDNQFKGRLKLAVGSNIEKRFLIIFNNIYFFYFGVNW